MLTEFYFKRKDLARELFQDLLQPWNQRYMLLYLCV